VWVERRNLVTQLSKQDPPHFEEVVLSAHPHRLARYSASSASAFPCCVRVGVSGQGQRRVGNASPCALGAAPSRTSKPSVLLAPRSLSKRFRPRGPIRAHAYASRHAPSCARRSPITPLLSSRQPSGAGGSTQSQSFGGARSTASGGSGSTPTTQSARCSPRSRTVARRTRRDGGCQR
jgi:hypothetical protein